MSFELRRGESFRKGLRRIAREQINDALVRLVDQPDEARDETVHEVRKSLKKLRAIVRLVRPAIGEATYRAENTCFRDAGRPLTEVRDARILLDTWEGLAEHFAKDQIACPFDTVHKVLQSHLRAKRKEVLDEQNAFSVVAGVIKRARKRIKDWTDLPNKWWVVGQGLEHVHLRAEEAFCEATLESTVEKRHEWRKQGKYLRYQLEILQPLWPERLGELTDLADRMAKLLGEDHDLAVLRQMLADDVERFGFAGEPSALLSRVDRQRVELEQEAKHLGERLFQDASPPKFARELKNHWKVWRAEAEPQPLRERAHPQ